MNIEELLSITDDITDKLLMNYWHIIGIFLAYWRWLLAYLWKFIGGLLDFFGIDLEVSCRLWPLIWNWFVIWFVILFEVTWKLWPFMPVYYLWYMGLSVDFYRSDIWILSGNYWGIWSFLEVIWKWLERMERIWKLFEGDWKVILEDFSLSKGMKIQKGMGITLEVNLVSY